MQSASQRKRMICQIQTHITRLISQENKTKRSYLKLLLSSFTLTNYDHRLTRVNSLSCSRNCHSAEPQLTDLCNSNLSCHWLICLPTPRIPFSRIFLSLLPGFPTVGIPVFVCSNELCGLSLPNVHAFQPGYKTETSS